MSCFCSQCHAHEEDDHCMECGVVGPICKCTTKADLVFIATIMPLFYVTMAYCWLRDRKDDLVTRIERVPIMQRLYVTLAYCWLCDRKDDMVARIERVPPSAWKGIIIGFMLCVAFWVLVIWLILR